MGKYKQLLSDTIIFAIGNFLTKLISFFLMPIYTMDMSTEAFGLSDLLTNALALCVPILSLSVAEGVFRFTLDKDSNKKEIISAGLRVLGISYLIIVPATLIVYICSSHFWWILFGFLYITESLKNLLAQLARGLQYIKTFAFSGIINAGILFISTYYLISFLHFEVVGYLLAYIIANIITIIYLGFVIKINKYISKVSKTTQLDLLKYSTPLVPNTLSWWFTNISSRYIIALFIGIPAAGLYSAAARIPALINVIASIFQQGWQYATVKNQESEDRDQFFINIYQVFQIIIFISGSIIITILPWICHFVLKGDFYKAWIYTPLLIVSALIGCFSIYFGTFYQMLKSSKKIMNTTILGAIVNTSIALGLVPIIDIWGALIASILGYASIAIYRCIDCQKILKIPFPIKLTIFFLILIIIQAISITEIANLGIYISYTITSIIFIFGLRKAISIYLQFKKP